MRRSLAARASIDAQLELVYCPALRFITNYPRWPTRVFLRPEETPGAIFHPSKEKEQ
jgi:hypothetical protein